MERMGQTNKRKSEEDGFEIKKEKKRRRSGSEAIEFLQEKSEKEMKLREKEIELKVKEQEGKTDQFSQMMQAMQQQQAQQQQQTQNLQILMAQQNKAMMSLLEKVISKNE